MEMEFAVKVKEIQKKLYLVLYLQVAVLGARKCASTAEEIC